MKNKTSNNNKKQIVKVPKQTAKNAKLRQKPKYKSFRMHKRIKHHAPKLPTWWVLLKKSLALIVANKKQIFYFALIYGFLNLLLVRGFSSPVDIAGLKETFSETIGPESAGLASGFTAFGLLLGASTTGSGDVAQVYQLVILIISTLALIWLYRQQQSGNKVTIKTAFYRGMYPVVPFTLVAFVAGLQLVPAIIGNFMYTTVIQNDLVIGFLEQAAWVLLFALTLLLSLYMLCSSLVALFIVTLPEMTPMVALRQARELVRFRRINIIKKLLAIILVIFALLFVIVLPVIFIAPVLAEWMFFAITVLGVPLVTGYLFSLYRELL